MLRADISGAMSVIRDILDRRALRTAFVLGGGGNLGAVQVGMFRALAERNVRPDLVVGCSVGALNAAAIAADPSPEGAHRLESLWCALRSEDVFPGGRLNGPWMLARRGEAMYSNDGLRRIIDAWLPYRTFEDAAVPLHVVATSLRTGIERWFSSGSVAEPLLASAALPAILPPVTIDGDPLIDGGVVDNVPVSKAVALGAKRVYVLHVGTFRRRRRLAPRRPLDVLIQAFSIARAHRFTIESGAPPEGVEVIVLPGVDPGPLRYNDFTRSRELIEQSRLASAAFLDGRAATAAAP